MPAIGITGGISTGKSSFGDCLRQLLPNAVFFDADRMARELVDLDREAKAEIEREFGAEVFSAGGDLNREQLRSIVFSSAEKRRALETILHPRIRRRWSADAQIYRNSPNFFFADIPLLYETHGQNLCDRVVVVACSSRIQFERLLQRTAMEPSEAQRIISAQMPLTEKIAKADHVVWNDGGRTLLADQAKLLVGL